MVVCSHTSGLLFAFLGSNLVNLMDLYWNCHLCLIQISTDNNNPCHFPWDAVLPLICSLASSCMGSDGGFHLAFLTVMVLTMEVKGPVLEGLATSKYVHPNFTFGKWGIHAGSESLAELLWTGSQSQLTNVISGSYMCLSNKEASDNASNHSNP